MRDKKRTKQYAPVVMGTPTTPTLVFRRHRTCYSSEIKIIDDLALPSSISGTK